MISVGYSKIKDHLLWVTPTSISEEVLDPNSVNKDYYLVLLLRQQNGYDFYVSLKEYLKLDQRNYPSSETDLKEYKWYIDNKDTSFHLWKLNKNNVEKLIDNLIKS